MMFGFLSDVARVAAVVIDVPVSIVADTVTLGGALNDKKTTYTGDAAGRFVDNVASLAGKK